MTICPHIWLPLDEHIEECYCGAVRQRMRRPPPLSQAERDKRRPLPPEVLADALQDSDCPPMGRVLGTFCINTTDIHGEPIQWPPLAENESHE